MWNFHNTVLHFRIPTLSVVLQEYVLNKTIQSCSLLKRMNVLYSTVLLDCLRLFQNFNVWKASMCTKSMCPEAFTQHLADSRNVNWATFTFFRLCLLVSSSCHRPCYWPLIQPLCLCNSNITTSTWLKSESLSAAELLFSRQWQAGNSVKLQSKVYRCTY